MRKLTIREIKVIADRMTANIIEAKEKEFTAAAKAIDAKNKAKAQTLIKEAKALPKALRELLDVKNLKLKTVLQGLRPAPYNKRFYICSWSLRQKITDELTIKQVDCPDVSALQKVVTKQFMAHTHF